MKTRFLIATALLVIGFGAIAEEHQDKFNKKPSCGQILNALKEGNARFVENRSAHPHSSADRRLQAAEQSQADHALATIVSCSDSRVPVELIFDAGIMDLFVVRVPGNICKEDEIGGVEYGVQHVFTPVVVVLGHSDCGAVTAAAAEGNGHKLERNIPALLKPIRKVVKSVRQENPQLSGKELIGCCIRENVYEEIGNLLENSASLRNAVKKGKITIAGAVYDIGSGKVEWLDGKRVDQLLKDVEANKTHATQEFAHAD